MAMTNNEPLLEVKDLHKSFGQREILKGINFKVHKGEVICIIGKSGSGKSTMIRCVNFLETLTSGAICYQGKNVLDEFKELSLYRTKVGMVFQSFNLFNNVLASYHKCLDRLLPSSLDDDGNELLSFSNLNSY